MDILMIAVVVLVLTNISFAWIAEQRRRTIQGLNQTIAHNQTRQFVREQRARDDGQHGGYRRAYGECYAVVLSAERHGASSTDAIRRLGTLHEAQSKQPEYTIQV